MGPARCSSRQARWAPNSVSFARNQLVLQEVAGWLRCFGSLETCANPDFSVVRGCEGPVFRGNAFLVWNTGC